MSPPKASCLTLEELRAYQQLYPYSLHHQRQQHYHTQQQELQAHQVLLRSSRGQPIGRPASAGPCYGYQPLLQQQLQLQEELLLLQRPGRNGQQQQYQHQHQQLQPPLSEPWHTGVSRWDRVTTAAAAAATHAHRREHCRDGLLPTDGPDSSSAGSRSCSPSSASALAGSLDAAAGQQHHQQQLPGQQGAVDLHQFYAWADKAWSPRSAHASIDSYAGIAMPAGAGVSNSLLRHAQAQSKQEQQQLPNFNGQVLPKALAALVTPIGMPRQRRHHSVL